MIITSYRQSDGKDELDWMAQLIFKTV